MKCLDVQREVALRDAVVFLFRMLCRGGITRQDSAWDLVGLKDPS